MPESAVLAGRYRLESLLGRGGMGEVWRGHDLGLDRPVAVKILAPQVTDAAMAARFAQEGRAAARIAHPNVVAMFDVGEDAGHAFLVMELLTGRSLAAELAERGPLPVPDVRDVGAQAAAGLDAAHRVGVVHRDIKPGNLHRLSNGVVKVLDFGIARLAGEVSARLTSAGTIVGTASYLAPEQARGHGGDGAADLYALGCVLYELLVGHPPFSGTAAEVISQHLTVTPVPPRHHRPEIPPDLDALVLALLAKDPAQRPPGAEAVRAALAGGPPPDTPAWPPGTAPHTAVLPNPGHVPSSRTRRMAVVGGVIGAVVLALVAAAILSRPDNPPAAAPPSSPSATPTSDPPSSAPPTPSSSPDVLAWLAELREATTKQQQMGGIDEDLARKTYEKINEVQEKYNEGDRDKAADKIRDLTRDLAKAQRKGDLAPNGPLVTFLTRSGLDRPTDNKDDQD